MAGAEILPFPQPMDSVATLMFELPLARGLGLAELQLANRLHQHLDIHSLLEQFLLEVRGSSPIQAICLTLPDSREVFLAGNGSGRNILKLRMQCAGEFLGDMEIQASADLKNPVEQVLSPLAAPLHNALLYHRVKLLARKDSLTGLGNRMALDAALATEVARAHRFAHPFSLLVVDIDHFKQVNDTFGHSTGDAVIRAVASQTNECLRPYDQAFRFGGEEFVVLLTQTGIAKARQIAERIRRSIADQCHVDTAPSRQITVSIGASEFRCTESLEDLFDRADQGLYAAKKQGRNRVIATP